MKKPAFRLYHNPRCGKSRQGLEICQKDYKTENLEIIEYLKQGLDEEEILDFLIKLIDPLPQIIRVKEEKAKNLGLTETKLLGLKAKEIATILAKNPDLLERPLLVGEKFAVIGRPPEKFKEHLK